MMRHVKHELQHVLSRMTEIEKRFPVQSSDEPFRDLADAIATLAEILLTMREEGTAANYITVE